MVKSGAWELKNRSIKNQQEPEDGSLGDKLKQALAQGPIEKPKKVVSKHKKIAGKKTEKVALNNQVPIVSQNTKNMAIEKYFLPAKMDEGQKEEEMVKDAIKKILINEWIEKLKNIKRGRDREGDLKSEEEIKKRYFEDVKNMAEIIKELGIDRVVTHGNPIYDKRTEWGLGSGYDTSEESKKIKPRGEAVEIKPDFDTQASIDILNRINENNEKPIFNEGAFIETIRSGTSKTQEERKNWEVIIYIDVGNKNTSIEVDEETKTIIIYADHHGETNPYAPSSTQTMFDIAKAGNLSLTTKNTTEVDKEREEAYLSTFLNSVNSYDNIEFLDVRKDPINPNSIPLVNENFLKENYVTSFYFLAKYLPFEIKQEILGKSKKLYKDGKPRDLFYTFTKEEINNTDLGKIETTDTKIENRKLTKYEKSKGEKGPKIVARKLTLKELVEKYQGEIDKTMGGAVTALNSMEKRGININSPTIGKFIFHNLSSFMKDNLAYITARAIGYPSYVRRDPATGIIFINSDGKHDLMTIWRKLNAIIPGYPKPIRNRFMYGPKDPEMQKKVKELISEEKLLDIIQNAEPEKEVEIKEGEEIKDIKVSATVDKETVEENVTKSSVEQIENIEDEIEKLKKRIQERMGSIEVENEKLNKLKENDRVIQDKLEEVNKKLRELN